MKPSLSAAVLLGQDKNMLLAKVTALPGVIILVGEKGIYKSVPLRVILVMRAVDF
jgi:hypothetical protein